MDSLAFRTCITARTRGLLWRSTQGSTAFRSRGPVTTAELIVLCTSVDRGCPQRALFAWQGGKLDDITVVMAVVDEEDVHVVRAPESEEEDAVETLVSDSEGVFPDSPPADEAVPESPAAPAAAPAQSTAPAAEAEAAAAAAAAAVTAPSAHAAALSNGHVAVRQQHAAAPPAVVARQAGVMSQAALCWDNTVRVPVVCSVTGKALQFYYE